MYKRHCKECVVTQGIYNCLQETKGPKKAYTAQDFKLGAIWRLACLRKKRSKQQVVE